MKVHLIAQSHIDPVFMWGWEEGLATTLNTCVEAVRKLHTYDDLRFSRSDALVHEWIKRFYPQVWPDIQKFCREGRWVPVGGWYTQADTNLPCGESLIRQALIGQQIFKKLLDHQSDIAYLVDSFGHPSTLPKILKHCGFEYFVLGRPREPLMKMACDLVRWVADDGSEILSFRVPLGYSTYANEIERVGAMVERTEGQMDRTMCFFGLGDHGGGPTTQQINRLLNYAKHPESPEMVFSDPYTFFQEAQREESPAEFTGDFGPFAIGCYSVAIRLKILHDRAQQTLLDAERWLAVAMQVDPQCPWTTYREKLNETWQTLLFTQFHDLLPGTSVREGLEHAELLAGRALADAAIVKTSALTHVSQQIDSQDEGYVRLMVFNNATSTRTVYFEYEPWLFWQDWNNYQLLDENDQPVPHQKIHPGAAARAVVRLIIKLDVPGHGYRSLRVVGPEPDFSNLAIHDDGQAEHNQRSIDTLASPRYQFSIDPQHGALHQVNYRPTDRALNLEYLFDAEVSEDVSDTWSMHITGYNKPLGRFAKTRSLQIEEGPLRWTMQLQRTYKNSTLDQEIRLYDDDDIIECHNQLNWQEPSCIVKTLIPSPYKNFRVRRGLAFGSSVVEERRCEFCFQNWLVIEPILTPDCEGNIASGVEDQCDPAQGPTHGLAILVGPGLHSADITERGIRLTLVRTPVFCHEELNQAYHPGVRHEVMDLGHSRSMFAVLPLWSPAHPAQLVDRAQHLTTGTAVVTTDAHAGPLASQGQFLHVSPDNVAVTAVKPAEPSVSTDSVGVSVSADSIESEDAIVSSDAVIIRVWETAGKDTLADVHWLDQVFEVNLAAHSLQTLRLTRDGTTWFCQSVNGLECSPTHTQASAPGMSSEQGLASPAKS